VLDGVSCGCSSMRWRLSSERRQSGWKTWTKLPERRCVHRCLLHCLRCRCRSTLRSPSCVAQSLPLCCGTTADGNSGGQAARSGTSDAVDWCGPWLVPAGVWRVAAPVRIRGRTAPSRPALCRPVLFTIVIVYPLMLCSPHWLPLAPCAIRARCGCVSGGEDVLSLRWRVAQVHGRVSIVQQPGV
jgi:hypothetical protein